MVESSQKAVEGVIPDETLNLPIGILLSSLVRPSTGSPGGIPQDGVTDPPLLLIAREPLR